MHTNGEDKTIISMRWCNIASCCLDGDIFSVAPETRARAPRAHMANGWSFRTEDDEEGAGGQVIQEEYGNGCNSGQVTAVHVFCRERARARPRHMTLAPQFSARMLSITRDTKIVFNLKPYRFPLDIRNMNDIKYKYDSSSVSCWFCERWTCAYDKVLYDAICNVSRITHSKRAHCSGRARTPPHAFHVRVSSSFFGFPKHFLCARCTRASRWLSTENILCIKYLLSVSVPFRCKRARARSHDDGVECWNVINWNRF